MIGDSYVGLLHDDGTFDARYAGTGWQIFHLPYALAAIHARGGPEVAAGDLDGLARLLLAHDWEYIGTPQQVAGRAAADIAWLAADGDQPRSCDLPQVIAGKGIAVKPGDADDIDEPFIRITSAWLPERSIAYLLDPGSRAVRLVPAGFPHPPRQAPRIDLDPPALS